MRKILGLLNIFKKNLIMDSKPEGELLKTLRGPGSGKGTQCAKIVENFGYVHLSAGDLLRKERDSGSQTAELIEKIINQGKIVPVEITCGLLKKAMEEAGWAEAKFLIDGYPRNQDNLTGWVKMMGEITTTKFMLFFDCPKEVLEKRLSQRGRKDDNPATIAKRWDTYVNDTLGIVKKYQEEGKVVRIDAMGTIEEVFERVKKHF